jgi:hypothetical protein
MVISATVRARQVAFLFTEFSLSMEGLEPDTDEFSLLVLLSLVIFVPVAIVYGGWVADVLGAV